MADDFELRMRLTAEAGSVQQASTQAATALSRVGAAGEQANAALATGAAKVTTATEAEAQAMAQLRAEVDRLAAANGVLTSRVAALEAQLTKARRPLDGLGTSSRQTAQAMSQLPMQITDVITSLASGMPVYMVAIQQGGQIRDSFGGIGNALTAVSSLLTVKRVALGSVAVALGSVALATYQASTEEQAYRRALILSNNAAGATVTQLTENARALDDLVGTQAKAADTLALLAQSGRIAAADLQRFAGVAIQLERNVGRPVEETVRAFESLAREPLSATLKLNEGVNYVTVSLLEQIRTLESQGRVVEAGRLAQEAYAQEGARQAQAIGEQLNWIERGWMAVKDAAKEGWEFIGGLGRAGTALDRLREAREELEKIRELRVARAGGFFAPSAADEGRAQGSVTDANRSLLREADAAAMKAFETQQVQAYQRARTENDRWTQAALTNAERLDRALARYRQNNAALASSGVALDPAQVAREEAAIRAQFRDRSPRDDSASQLREARQRAEIEAIRSDGQAQANAYGEGLRLLDALRQADQVKEGEYYAARRAAVQEAAAAQVAALAAENAALSSRQASATERVANEQRVAANRAQMAQVQARAATDLAILNAQEGASIRQTQQAYDDYLRSLQTVAAERQRERAAALGQASGQPQDPTAGITADFANRRAQLDAQRDRLGDQEYARRLAALEEFHQQELAREQAHQAALRAVQNDTSMSWENALRRYSEQGGTAAQQTEAAYGRAFQGMEDALVSFATTGKADFKSFADSVISDLIRIYIRQQLISFLATAFAPTPTPTPGFASNAGISGGRAAGGSVRRGGLYEIEENGPEVLSVGGRTYLAMGKDSGTVGRNVDGRLVGYGGAGGGASPTVNVPITLINQSGKDVQAESRQRSDGGVDVILTAIKDAIADDIGSGTGSVSTALRGRYGLRPTMG